MTTPAKPGADAAPSERLPALASSTPNEARVRSVELEARPSSESPRGSGMPVSEGEPSAADQLQASGQLAEWERRAVWLESEAKSQSDPGIVARLLLAASEVRAMCGARTEGRRLAVRAASELRAPEFANRQARALGHGEVGAIVKGLRDEARAAKSPAVQAHANYAAAEALRLLQHDEGAAEAFLDAAESSDPSDFRPTLQRLSRQLGRSSRAPDVRIQPDEGLRGFRHAVGQLSRLRGAEAPRLGAPDIPAVYLVEAQRAFSRGKLTDAAESLRQLETHEGLRAPVQWLVLSWQSLTATDHGALLLDLARLVREHPGRAERRALAARALGRGSYDLVLEALDDGAAQASAVKSRDRAADHQSAFSNTERISLAALIGRVPNAASADSLDDPALAPLLAAIERTGAQGARPVPAAAAPSDSEFALGRLAAKLERFADYDANAAVVETNFCDTLLRLERARECRDLSQLGRYLPLFTAVGTARAECSFLAAVWTEQAGDIALARDLYRLALPSPATREAAVRVLSRHTTDGAAMFRSLSVHATDPVRRAALLTEALLRLGPEAPEYDALAEEAVKSDPDQPLAYHLAEIAARMRGDRARVARWLTRQRERARGADELAFASLREAVFLVTSNAQAATALVQRSLTPESSDDGARRWLERWGNVSNLERANARRRAADSASPRVREYLLFDATASFLAAGDAEAAARAARQMTTPLGVAWVERLSTQPHDLEWLVEYWTRRLADTQDPELAAEMCERLSQLEQGRGRHDAATFWQKKRLALEPMALPALRFLAIESMGKGRETELEQVGAELCLALNGPAMLGHAFVAARLAIDRGAHRDARAHSMRAVAHLEPPLWALRLEAEYAREDENHRSALATLLELRKHAQLPLDVATLSVRAAAAAAALDDVPHAIEQLARARAASADDVVVLAARLDLARQQSDPVPLAEALEELASATRVPSMRAEYWMQAANIWLDAMTDSMRGLAALDRAAAASPHHPGIDVRTRELLARAPELPGVRALALRIGVEQGPSLDAEVSRAKQLTEAGLTAEARKVIDAVLELHPRHAGALEHSARLHLRERAWQPAEQAWLALLAASPAPEAAQLARRGLASLYESELSSSERCGRVYAQLLDTEPEDVDTRRKLVRLLLSSGDRSGAVAHQRQLLERSKSDEERRRHMLELIEYLEPTREGAHEAEQLLERAHRTWPEDVEVLQAAVDHYQRTGNPTSARVVSERATNEVRNAIQAGRLEPQLFETLELSARLAGDAGLARLARAAGAALNGRAQPLGGAGSVAGDLQFDELLAPPPLSSGLRRFLYGAGTALERTYAVDPYVLEPTLLADAKASEARAAALAFGIAEVRVMVSDQIGFDCIYLHADPPCIVFGASVLAHGNAKARDFTLFRALKLAQSNTSALAHMPEAELWAAVAGFLACFAPAWPARGDDAQRLIAQRNKIRPHVTATLGPELVALANAVTANVVPQARLLGDSLWRWASRVALLGTGDLASALEAMFLSTRPGHALPKDREAWSRWLATSEHARDLVGYSVSEAYTEARRRAGLSTSQA